MITIENKEKLIEFVKENKLVILLFSATWCGPCKKLKEKLIEDKEILRGFQIGYCDIDDENLEELVEIYKISSIPTIIFLSLQESSIVEIKRIIGYDLIGLEMYINSLVKKDY
tara:strand:+ start:233 stop:571 length:339 start_codon:yes stop_codon:yes gene_type:complete